MTRVDVDAAAVAALAESDAMSALLQKACDRVAEVANSTLEEGRGYMVSSRTGRESPPSSDRVYAGSAHAMNSNARHNTLLRALGSV